MLNPNKVTRVWLFLTDRCNLGCGYCFYRYKTGKRTLTSSVFENILAFIRDMAPVEFIFSGGEPLMEANLLKAMIEAVRKNQLSQYISVQSNATLLEEPLMAFFLKERINLEVGIDGDEETTQCNRPGVNGVNYGDILQGVHRVVSGQGPFTATMTVHPGSAVNLLRNLQYLAAMGIKSLEVHPAFLEDWDARTSKHFLDQYRLACIWELKNRRHGLIGRGYSLPAKGGWDLLTVPDGKGLPNWVFLSFPETIREQFYIMDFNQDPSRFFLGRAKSYFQELRDYIVSHPHSSYRRISNFNAMLAIKTSQGRRFEKKVRTYIELCERIEDIDNQLLRGVLKQPPGIGYASGQI